jgi:formylglycine-generating enzyme required for sulfatase activity
VTHADQIPNSFDGRYELVLELASGGMGSVYIGRQRGAAGFERLVAIKRMHRHVAESPEQVSAFLDEARLASSIRHPNVVGVHDVHQLGDEIVLVMDYVDGVSVARLFKKLARQAQAAPLSIALRILVEALHGLQAAHDQRDVMGRPLNIVHRDATPHNILVAENGSVCITDFGIAKAAERSQQTATGLAKGKASYMAPEQLAGAEVDRRTDVFAMGLTALELLSGTRAFGDTADMAAVMAIAAGDIPRLATRRPDLPAELDRIIARATAFSMTERWESASDFAQALEGVAPVASQREVATLVQSLFGSELEARRAKLRAALTAGQLSPLETVSPETLSPSRTAPGVVPAARPAPRRRPLAVAAAGVVIGALSVALVAGLWALSRDETTPAEVVTLPPAAAPAARSAVKCAPTSAPAAVCPAGMLLVAGGKFFMGSQEPQAVANERPVAHVTIDDFCIDRTEVTASAYRDCSNQGECRRATPAVDWPGITDSDRLAYVDACNSTREDRAEHPVNCVDWAMAQGYCRFAGKRLPTEAQWEYAARGPDGRLYPWGDALPTPVSVNACGGECASWAKEQQLTLQALPNYDDRHPATAPVKSFPRGRSPYGAYNLTGNVWEWTATWFAPYTAEPTSNPVGPPQGERKVIRGGGWNSGDASWLRPSFRFQQVPTARHPAIGFRCASPRRKD